MVRFASPEVILPRLPPVYGVLSRISHHVLRTRDGFDASARLSGIRPDVLRDTHLSAEALTGESAHQEPLPFFLQAGFGRRQD
jgi:hypothetical protein